MSPGETQIFHGLIYTQLTSWAVSAGENTIFVASCIGNRGSGSHLVPVTRNLVDGDPPALSLPATTCSLHSTYLVVEVARMLNPVDLLPDQSLKCQEWVLLVQIEVTISVPIICATEALRGFPCSNRRWQKRSNKIFCQGGHYVENPIDISPS